MSSELSRGKPYIRDLERAAAAARTEARAAQEAAAVANKDLAAMRQQHDSEVEQLSGNLGKMRFKIRYGGRKMA